MKSLNSALETLVWYSKRPRLIPELYRVAKRKYILRTLVSDTQVQAVQWCQACAMTTAEAIAEITGMTAFEPVKEKYPDVFLAARDAAQECPIKMGGAANLDLLFWLSEYLHAERVIETGVAYGWSSLAILLSLSNRDNSLLVSTDMPYPKQNSDAYVGCVVPAGLRLHWHIINSADREALPKALRSLPSIDMCHYDSDKSYAGRMWAFPLLWNALRSGGIFISDDIGDNLAFHDFCKQINHISIIVQNNTGCENKYQGILLKTWDEKPEQS